MPNNGVPIHENAHLWSTNTRKRPFMEYQYTKTPIYGVPIHENVHLWSTNTRKRPFMEYLIHENPQL